MPSELKLNLISARKLPVMDKKRKTTDTYCIIRFGRTDPKKKQIMKQLTDTGAENSQN